MISHPDLNINLNQRGKGMDTLKGEYTSTSVNLKDGDESNVLIDKQKTSFRIDEKMEIERKEGNVIYYLNLFYINYNI